MDSLSPTEAAAHAGYEARGGDPVKFPDTPYWIWEDLARADYQRQWPRWFWRRLFMWWAGQAGKSWTR